MSRKLRFDDFFYGQYEESFSLDKSKKLKILEIGCGPGALADALHSIKSAETNRVINVINEKYDSRIELYRKGDKQWDTSTSITMIIRGINNK